MATVAEVIAGGAAWGVDCSDAVAGLRGLPDGCVQCCLTSPPFFSLRDYGTATWEGGSPDCDHAAPALGGIGKETITGGKGTQHETRKSQYRSLCGKCGARRVDRQIGLEDTPDAYAARLVEVFREVRRILHPSGTLWLNLGSCYSQSAVFSDEYRIREDLTSEERRYVALELSRELRHVWAADDSSNDQPSPLPGVVWCVLPEEVQGGLLPRPGECGEPEAQGSRLSPETQGEEERRGNGKESPAEGGDHSATGGPVRLLRGTRTEVPLPRSRQRRRKETPGVGQREHADNLPTSTQGGVSDGQVSDSVLELQCGNWAVGFLSSLCLKRETVPERLLSYFYRRTLYKPKDMINVPFLVAEALRADGWYLRCAPPWIKDNCMPESVTDRLTTAHEYWFLLAKGPRYFWDADAVRVPHEMKPQRRLTPHSVGCGPYTQRDSERERDEPAVDGNPAGRNLRTSDVFYQGLDDLIEQERAWLAHLEHVRAQGGMLLDREGDPLALLYPTFAFPGAHFATFSPHMITPLLKAATSEKGCCPACGAPWVRQTERRPVPRIGHVEPCRMGQSSAGAKGNIGLPGAGATPQVVTTGWRPSCACPPADAAPCLVLDCFAGSGTVGLVARRLGRRFVGFDLNEQYVTLARQRIESDAPLFNGAAPAPASSPERTLFDSLAPKED